jgi:hypothetical protein
MTPGTRVLCMWGGGGRGEWILNGRKHIDGRLVRSYQEGFTRGWVLQDSAQGRARCRFR